MSDGLPPISMEISGDGAPYVIVGEQQATDVDALLQLAPNLADPYWLKARAQLTNHVAKGFDFEVILDPAEFEKTYMDQYNSEDPTEDVAPGVIRLTQYGIPSFDMIEPPAMEGDTLIFFARNVYMGFPYRVEAPIGGTPVYTPLALRQEELPGPDGDAAEEPGDVGVE